MNIIYLISIIAAVVALLYYVMLHIPHEQRKRFDKKLGDINTIHKIMDRLRAETVIQRVLIWKSTNGKGIAKFGSNIKMSVVYESYEAPFKSVKEDYQNIITDGAAIDALIQVQSNGEVMFYTDDMKSGILKRMNEGDLVYWSMLFAIGPGNDEAFYYASVDISGNETPFQIGQGAKIDIAKNGLRNMYRKLNMTPIKRLRKSLYL